MSSMAIAGRRASIVAPGRTSSLVYLQRRAVAVVGLLALVLVLTVAVGRVGAQAGLEDPVAGSVVVQPGETLWDVAAATAPDGMDPRRQLAAIRELNAIEGGHLDAWAVVLIPAH